MKWAKNLSKMLSDWYWRRRGGIRVVKLSTAARMKILRANNVNYRRACETAIKAMRNADSMLSGAHVSGPEHRAAQSQLRFGLNATCEFIARVTSECDV